MNEQKTKKEARSKRRFWKFSLRSPAFKILLLVFVLGLIGVSATFLYFYNQYSKVIDRKLSGEVFKNTARIYAAPYRIYPGQKITPELVVAHLQRAGFETTANVSTSEGHYEVNGSRITIEPAVGDPLRLEFQKGTLSRIVKSRETSEADEAWLPAELVTNLFDASREKRRVVEFKEMPKDLVNALIAAEDQRFYSHYGIDPVRIVGALIADIRRKDEPLQGASTITQQLARNFFLSLDRSLDRKLREAFIALILEQRLTKEQILTMYANEIYLGQRGSFSIHGFGEGAAAYFGKDIGELTLPEAAMMVGVIPAPNSFSPTKYPDRAKARRNLVLTSMHSLGMIDDASFEKAKAAEVKVAPVKVDASDAPYLVDFIRDELLKNYSEEALINDNLKIYTSLDPDLQRAAVDAVDKGLKAVTDAIAARNKARKKVDNLPPPQAAMIALDPHTGEIKAMVGGGNYGASQYNRITQAFRQPGSIFKPFVYGAAFEQAFDEPPADAAASPEAQPPAPVHPEAVPSAEAADVRDDQVAPPIQGVITPITSLIDEPTTFYYEGGREYKPDNYKQQYRGTVTVRTALQHSLNVPTIRVAEHIGYDRVAAFAKRAGLNGKIRGYPSIALGAFEVTPIEMAGAYTIFANEGKRMEPHALLRVTSPDPSLAKTYKYEPTEVIRPELAFLMTYLMEGVINSGTAAGVRARGFTLPAAGKTGTSRDGWFAGYTKGLLAIAWVGYDDNRDLDVEGARSALPIWTDFMMKAYQIYPVRDPDAMLFEPPPGIDFVRIDSETLALAGPNCTDTFEEAFLSGTAPTIYCPLHTSHFTDMFGNGAGAIGSGVKEGGAAIGRAVRGLGRVFGGLFSKPKEPEPLPEPKPPARRPPA